MLYLSTTPSEASKATLNKALDSLLAIHSAKPLYTLTYTQSQGPSDLKVDGRTLTMRSPRVGLSFDDSSLDVVREAWGALWERYGWEGERGEFMAFEDREGVDDDEM